jgi:hypothetical protein
LIRKSSKRAFVKDIAAGKQHIAVLTAYDPLDQNPRTGRRIDFFTADGDLQQSCVLTHPASYIQYAPDGMSLWVLHEAASHQGSFEAEYPYLVEYVFE